MREKEYIIVGDTDEFSDCLVFTCGESRQRADEILSRILTNPTDNDKRIMEGLRNFRIKEIPKERCWWNGNCD